MNVKIIGTVNVEELKKTAELIAYEIYIKEQREAS